MSGQNNNTEDLAAADAFVQNLVAKADSLADGVYPLWHGWALREAFLAGIKHAKRAPSTDKGGE